MAANRSRNQAAFPVSIPSLFRQRPRLLLISAALVLLLSLAAFSEARRLLLHLFPGTGVIAPLFTAEVDHWADEIGQWAAKYEVDPNLLATVMQIESCGHPTVSSYAGAQGLFQVMPFHFDVDENQLDPETNARRGASFLRECLGWAEGDSGLALACYNGGPSILQQNHFNWDDQVKRYYTWGTGIYADALVNRPQSQVLESWLNAGGQRLCDQAAAELGIS